MAIHRLKNFQFQNPPCEDRDIFERCNIMQITPGTKICEGKTGLNFIRCNLTNAALPADAKFDQCRRSRVEFCENLHPKFKKHGLTAEGPLCQHRVGSTKQWVEIDEKEFRRVKRSTDPDKPALNVTKEVDADGITVHVFTKRVWVYADNRLGRIK
jgi:hypothetical protein